MRTTGQMLDQGELTLEKYGVVDDRMSLELLLDRVLADVPDPYEATSALVNADRRIRELEAKLAKVRALAVELKADWNPPLSGTGAELLAILDGKEAPCE